MAEARTFILIITQITGALFDGQVLSVTVPGTAGEMTLLPSHEPLVTTLRAGKATARTPNGESREFELERGVMECSGNVVTVLL